MKRTMKKLVSLVLALAISLTATVPAFAVTNDKVIQVSKNSKIAVAQANIADQSNIITLNERKANVSGAVSCKLKAIGSGLVDADWEMVFSKGLITYIDMNIGIKHGFLYSETKYIPVLRKCEWTKAERGSEQTSWEIGTRLKCDLSGSVEVNGQFDYPISAVDYGVTTVK